MRVFVRQRFYMSRGGTATFGSGFMFVFTEVSSINTKRRGSRCMVGRPATSVTSYAVFGTRTANCARREIPWQRPRPGLLGVMLSSPRGPASTVRILVHPNTVYASCGNIFDGPCRPGQLAAADCRGAEVQSAFGGIDRHSRPWVEELLMNLTLASPATRLQSVPW